MKNINLRAIRDRLKFLSALILSPIYLPHLLAYLSGNRELIMSDIAKMKRQLAIRLSDNFALLFFLHNNSFYRTLFYHRIGYLKKALISWYRPGNRYFNISMSTKIGKGFTLFHPYSSVINANSIGDNFSCLQLTTLGSSHDGRPTIGNDVALAANVTIVGGVRIGNNVEIGAGAVVVKDIPDNSVAAGVPAKVIKSRPPRL